MLYTGKSSRVVHVQGEERLLQGNAPMDNIICIECFILSLLLFFHTKFARYVIYE